ncbi:MAG: hypothetical protein LBV60_22400 [Streptomyces sp.]|nr:hypothetical protein [Streptomyces sp.]
MRLAVLAERRLVVYGAGAGFITRTTLLVSQNNVEARDLGVASSTATLIRTIGGAFGVTVMGTVFTSSIDTGANGAHAQLDAASLARMSEAARSTYTHAVVSGSHKAFALAALIAAVGFLTAWLLKDVPLADGNTPQATRPAAPLAKHHASTD